MTSRSQTSRFIEMAGPDGPRLVQLPGLDGLRGLAVVAVVLYHVGFGWMVGGYLGVSTFFTLSGFLITSLLINESRRTGTISLGGFWGRRFRRLLPASLLTLFLVVTLFGRLVADADQRNVLGGNVLSALFNVANWHSILSGSKYGDFAVSPSPVVHFWSLSIEEQFYLVFPLFMVVLWKVVKGRREILGGLFVGLAALSAILPLIFSMSTNRAYLGSDTRAGEMFLGGALAVVLSYEPVRRSITLRYRPRVALIVASLVCAAVQVYFWVTVEQQTRWLYRGGLFLYAAMTCVVIAASAMPVGPLSMLTSTRLPRWLGARSYGIYLYHWPLLLVARHLAPEWGITARAVAALAVTLVVAELSFRFLEQPIRLGRWPVRGQGVKALRYTVAAFVAVAVVAAVPLPVDKSKLTTDFESALKEFNQRPGSTRTGEKQSGRPGDGSHPDGNGTDGSGGGGYSGEANPGPSIAPTIGTFGDSTALLAGMGLGDAIEQGDISNLADSPGSVALGCGVSRFKLVKLEETRPPSDECLSWEPRWSQVISDSKPEIAQLITGAWELPDAQLPGTDTWTSIGNADADAFIHSELTAAVQTLSATGAMVLIYKWPPYAPWTDTHGYSGIAAQTRPERMEHLHELMDRVARENPTKVRVLDMSEFLGPDRLADRSLRPDGLHIQAPKMQELYSDGLAEKIHSIYASWFRANNR